MSASANDDGDEEVLESPVKDLLMVLQTSSTRIVTSNQDTQESSQPDREPVSGSVHSGGDEDTGWLGSHPMAYGYLIDFWNRFL